MGPTGRNSSGKSTTGGIQALEPESEGRPSAASPASTDTLAEASQGTATARSRAPEKHVDRTGRSGNAGWATALSDRGRPPHLKLADDLEPHQLAALVDQDFQDEVSEDKKEMDELEKEDKEEDKELDDDHADKDKASKDTASASSANEGSAQEDDTNGDNVGEDDAHEDNTNEDDVDEDNEDEDGASDGSAGQDDEVATNEENAEENAENANIGVKQPEAHGGAEGQPPREDGPVDQPTDQEQYVSDLENPPEPPTRPNYTHQGVWAKPPADLGLDFIPVQTFAQVSLLHLARAQGCPRAGRQWPAMGGNGRQWPPPVGEGNGLTSLTTKRGDRAAATPTC